VQAMMAPMTGDSNFKDRATDVSWPSAPSVVDFITVLGELFSAIITLKDK